nr:MAG TPA: hypothetical protein [Bacteriophage sp.]
MGYYTNFKIEFGNHSQEDEFKLRESIKQCCPQLVSALEYEYPSEYEDYLLEEEIFIYAKWYDFDREISALSEKHPNLNITLYGHGEEIGDEWVAYAKAGQYEDYRLEYPNTTLW